ncbi:hypothetical protein FQA39_LY05749 [Lamprigera yunnana]|nr:hypothetical protein FQA39_LY05749 [Lamprigera yunnana]
MHTKKRVSIMQKMSFCTVMFQWSGFVFTGIGTCNADIDASADKIKPNKTGRFAAGKLLLPECYRQLQKATWRILCLIALAAKTDKTGLIGAECTCIHDSLRTVSSKRNAQKYLLLKTFTATDRKFKRKRWKCTIGLYDLLVTTVLTFPVYNLPLTQVTIDTVDRATVTTKGCPEFMNRFQSGSRLINQDSNGELE